LYKTACWAVKVRWVADGIAGESWFTNELRYDCYWADDKKKAAVFLTKEAAREAFISRIIQPLVCKICELRDQQEPEVMQVN